MNIHSLTIIPARAGSKRILNKNKVLLNGEALIKYSIKYAQANLPKTGRIIVSTDDLEIKQIAIDEGVEVIDRPIELAGDEVPTLAVLQQVLELIDEISLDTVILLQPTNPLRTKDLLKRGLEKFRAGEYDSLMSVSRNYQKFGRLDGNCFQPYNYTMGQRSQDLEPLYFENGLLYIFKKELLQKGESLGKHNFALIENHPVARIDIDTYEDLEYAEFLLAKYKDELF